MVQQLEYKFKVNAEHFVFVKDCYKKNHSVLRSFLYSGHKCLKEYLFSNELQVNKQEINKK